MALALGMFSMFTFLQFSYKLYFSFIEGSGSTCIVRLGTSSMLGGVQVHFILLCEMQTRQVVYF